MSGQMGAPTDAVGIFREARDLARNGQVARAQALAARLRGLARTAATLGLALGEATPQATGQAAGQTRSGTAGDRAVALAGTLAGADAVPLLLALAEALLDAGCPAEADAVLQHALRQDPADPDVLWRRAEALLELGEVPASHDLALMVQARHPRSPMVAAGAAHMLNYLPGIALDQTRAAHAAFASAVQPEQPLPPSRPRRCPRPLRLAFVSPDLYTHSVAFFLEPVLSNRHLLHPHGAEVLLVNTGVRHDATTERLVAAAGGPTHFVDAGPVSGLSAAEVVAAVRAWQPGGASAASDAEPGVDIAIDLAGLTPFNGLHLFAHRLAPLQLTWLGYPNTTALPQMDARIVDALTDPPEASSPCTERLIRMAGPFVCYRPPPAVPDVAPIRPADAPVTFGSFNIARKISDPCAALWARVLASVPGSRLVVKSATLASPASRRRLADRLVRAGIPPDRLSVLSPVAGVQENLAAYQQIDVALDTWPYCGTTTTCEALLMGVPVVSLTGETHASRVGASVLAAIGQPQWAARSADEFVQQAAALATLGDPARPPPGALRQRLLQSPLCDASGFARRFGEALTVALAAVPAS
ncbi:MAG: tetratricopeptide repeat protein [bacterium]